MTPPRSGFRRKVKITIEYETGPLLESARADELWVVGEILNRTHREVRQGLYCPEIAFRAGPKAEQSPEEAPNALAPREAGLPGQTGKKKERASGEEQADVCAGSDSAGGRMVTTVSGKQPRSSHIPNQGSKC